MATIVNGIVGTNESGVYDPSPFFDALEDAFEFVSVSGTNANKIFKLSDKISIKFTNFDRSKDESPEINIVVNGIEIKIASWTYGYYYPTNLGFRLTKGDSGDLIVQIEDGNYTDRAVHNSADFMFAIVAVENAVSKESAGYGIYIPWSHGTKYSSSEVSSMDPTPKYLITDDTTDDMSNMGYAGDTSSALRYICKEGLSKITALVPIAAICSECVSTNSWVMMLTDNYRNGYAQMNGEKYYCVGGFCMYEGAADNA